MAVGQAKTTDLRLAELMAAISMATDLQHGYPPEKDLWDTLLAVGAARALGLDGQDLSDVYYTALLHLLGFTAHAHELAAFVGSDEVAALRGGFTGDWQIIGKAALDLVQQRPLDVAALFARTVGRERRVLQAHAASACDRLPEDYRPQKGAAHHLRRQEHSGRPPQRVRRPV